MLTSTKLKLAYVGLAVTDTLLSGSSNPAHHKARFVTKPLLMPTLMASLATNPRAADSPLRTSTLIAQAGGWGGDVALIGDAPKNFALGSGSFAVGHAAYITGFLRNRGSRPKPGPKKIAALWALTAPGVVYGAAKQEPMLGPTIGAYSATLASMTVASTQLSSSIPRKARRLTVAGALTFMASDSILGMRKFLLNNPPPQMETAVMATYTAAQFLLSEGAAQAGATS